MKRCVWLPLPIEGRRTGIRWNFTNVLEDLDFGDDIALLAPKYEHIQEKLTG